MGFIDSEPEMSPDGLKLLQAQAKLMGSKRGRRSRKNDRAF
jgi:hypothetical protein